VTVLVDQRLEFEGISVVRAARPTTVEWPDLPSASTEAALGETTFLKAELVITDRRGRRQAALPVDFDRRVQGETAVSLLGSGAAGAFLVSLDAKLPLAGVRMRFRFASRPESTPGELSQVIRWFEALRPGRQLGLWMRDRGRWGVGPDPIPDDHPRVPEDYAHAVHVLARIQQRSGVDFAMPEEIDDDDAQSIGVTDALVKGETVAGRWTDASIQEDPQLLRFLEDSEHGVMLEFKATHHLRLGGQQIPIGEVEYRFLQVRHAEHDQKQQLIRLVPGQNDRFEVRLVGVAEAERPDGSTNWVPAAMLEPYAGRWIAQSGTQVLLSAASFAEAAEKIRARGRLATVWRVPGSAEEAEVLPAVGL
jgi:hypothetical protein